MPYCTADLYVSLSVVVMLLKTVASNVTLCELKKTVTVLMKLGSVVERFQD